VTAINPYEPPREPLPQVAVPGTLPVRATGILTGDDFVGTLKAVGQWRPRLAIVAVVVLVLSLVYLVTARGMGEHLWLGATGVAVALVLLLLFITRGKRRLRDQWNARVEHREPISWTFAEEGLYIETVHSKHFHAWTAFVQASIRPDKLILTQQGGGMWNFIPRRFFASEGDWQAATQLVTAKLPLSQSR